MASWMTFSLKVWSSVCIGYLFGGGVLMTERPVGSKWQLFIPQELAYGQRGAGKDIKPYSTLIFDVEVIGIENEK